MADKGKKNSLAASSGFINNLVLRIKLVIRLLNDRRVNTLIKIIPFACLAYTLLPINIPGPLDEVGVLWIGYYLFVELCPPEVVEEHMLNLRNPTIERMQQKPNPDSVIDAEYKEVQEQRKGEEGQENKPTDQA